MKKAFATIISLTLALCLSSCSGNTLPAIITDAENKKESTSAQYNILTNTLSETVTVQTSERETEKASVSFYCQTAVTFRPAFGEGENTALSYENSEYVTDIIKNGTWDEGTSDCLNDVTFTVCGKNYFYHVSCGTFNDYSTEKSLQLTKSQMGKINDMLGPLGYLYGESENVELSVEISPESITRGNNFVLTARATNNTGKTIYVTLPTSSPNMHYEIRVKIEDESGKRFVDLDTQGKEHTDEAKTFSVENGETITQVMNIAPGYLLDGSIYPLGEEIKYFPAGTYKGTATFTWHDSFDPDTYKYGEEHRKTINFDVEVH